MCVFFFFQAEDGIRDYKVTGVQTCALPISVNRVEGAAEDADGLHYIARARVSPEAGGSPQMSAASNASSSHASPTTRPLIMRSTRAARSASAANGSRDARRSA